MARILPARICLGPATGQAREVFSAAWEAEAARTGDWDPNHPGIPLVCVVTEVSFAIMRLGMNLFLWTTHVTQAHVPLFGKLRRQGYQGVEIPTIDGDLNHYRDLRRALDDEGLGCTTVTFLSPDQDPLSRDAKQRQRGLDHIQWALEVAAVLGADVVCGPLHSSLGVFSGFGATADEIQRSVEFLQLAAPMAQDTGVVIALEYLNRFESYLVNTAADTAALVRQVDHPAIRCAYDTHHAHIEEQQVAAAIRSCSDVLAHVQLSESHRGAPGTGQVDWQSTIETLREVDYQGWLMLESFSRANPEFAKAVFIWRDHAASPEAVWQGGYDFLRPLLEQGL